MGDKCIIVNAENIHLTGRKARKKTVTYHSGFQGCLKVIPYAKFLTEKPE